MSAIFGILRFDGEEMNARDLERMSHTLAHRGPDGRKFVVDGAVGLGHCLMRVNQEDMFEAQPLHDVEASLTLVADCRIDNREELADVFNLSAVDTREMPDSAFILRAYKTWGENCAEHLLGDFVFAIWDGRAKKLVIARDHMGQRYLHYHRGNGFFVFATDVRALWAVPRVPRKLSDIMIGRYLLMAPSLTSNASLFEGIHFPFGGSTLVVDADGKMTERRYWEPHADPTWLNRTEDEYVEHFRSALSEAVECRIRRLIAPPALCLSAGYDSAAIAGLTGPVLTAQGRKMIAVSSVMAEDYDGPLPHARRWVELCRRGMSHLDVRYFVRTNESDYADVASIFFEDNSIPDLNGNITSFFFRRASAAGARLIMDGLGGDDTLNPRGGGSLRYLLKTRRYGRFLTEAIAHRRKGLRAVKQILWNDMFVGQAPFWLLRTLRRMRRGTTPSWADWPISQSFAAALVETNAIDPSEVLSSLRPYAPMRARLEWSLRAGTARSCPHFANLAASHALDITRPMLDKRGVEFGLAIPEDLYVRNGRDRYLACRALANIYPREFQTRLPNQDPRDPDYVRMLRAALPILEAEVEQLAQNTTLRKYIDFIKLRNALNELREGASFSPKILHALRAFNAAKCVAAFYTQSRQQP